MRRQSAASRFFKVFFTAAVVCGVGIGGYLLFNGRPVGTTPEPNSAVITVSATALDQESVKYFSVDGRYNEMRTGVKNILASYIDELRATKAIRDRAKRKAARNLVVKDIRKLFIQTIVSRVIPFWEGTNSSDALYDMSIEPGEGKISEAAFVVRVLSDAGLNLAPNERTWVEASPEAIINKLLKGREGSIVRIDRSEISQVDREFEFRGPGLYFVALDNKHRGFVHYDGKTKIFYHAKPGGKVVGEPVKKSDEIIYADRVVIGKISANTNLLQRWSYNNPIR